MELFLSALLDALLDLCKILPFVFAVHLLIAFVEQSTSTQKKLSTLLNGKLSPVLAGGLGLIPQCGFSMVATKLYAKRKVAVGTLAAVYIASSDEALPILIASGDVGKILPIILIKLVFAILAGYVLNLVVFQKTDAESASQAQKPTNDCQKCGHDHAHDESDAAEGCACGCTHAQPANGFYAKYLRHPLMHTLTVGIFILLVNLAFNLMFGLLGEENILQFLEAHKLAQPFIAALVGLIPNCGASVVIAQSYVLDGLGLGGAVAGLSVAAGVAYAVLVKENPSVPKTIAILAGMYLSCSLLGLAITLCGF